MAQMCSFATISIAVLCVLRLEINGELCKRMYFGHGREVEMPFVQLEGIYVFQNNDSTGHPLFKHEQRNYYFQYHSSTNQMYFTNTSNGHDTSAKFFMGVLASMERRFSLSNWEDLISDNIYPFQSFITKWYYYNGASSVSAGSLGKWQAYLKCVPEDVFKCSSGQLFFNTTITSNGQQTLHSHTTENFSLISGVYINFRQVYKHSKHKNWFLFYHSNVWTVGPDYNNASGYLRAVGNPLRPEFLQTNWEYWNGKWVYFKQPVGLKCRGLNRKHNNGSVITCADSNPCQNNGRCMDISLTNETVCICPDAFKGPTCSTPVRSCGGAYKPSVSVLSYHVNGRKVNDFATVFCATGYSPRSCLQQCQYNGIKSSWTQQCCKITWSSWSSTRRRSYRSSRRRSKRRVEWLLYLFVFVVILQILVPAAHVIFAIYRDKSESRTLSIDAYIALVLWLTYYSLCTCTRCTKYARELSYFLTMSIVMVISSYLCIFAESFFSTEKKYISNILQDGSAMDFVNTLKRKRVERNMMVECWHMETRTRTVYYTDSNGNQQSRVETYQEMVVTYRENNPFLYGNCEDISDPEGPKINRKGVTRLKLLKDVECGDDETEDKFNEMKQEMVTRNEHRDANITFSLEDTIPGFEKRICAYADTSQKAWWMNLSCYWLSTVFLCSWPFRIMFNWKTTKAEYTIKKRLFIGSPPARLSAPPSAPNLPQHGLHGFVNIVALNGVSYDGANVNLLPAPQGCPPPYPTTNDQVSPPVYNQYPPVSGDSFAVISPDAPPPDYNMAARTF
eukprot:gene13881-15329_t